MDVMGSESLKLVWQEWQVKVAVVLSLVLQWLLLVLGTFRKRRANYTPLRYLIHGIYFLSSKVAFFAFYLIVGARLFAINQLPFGLWAAVMALHVSGQERLTAFTYKDNDGWKGFTGLSLLNILAHLGLFFPLRDLPLPTSIMLVLAVWRILCTGFRMKMGTEDMRFAWKSPKENPVVFDAAGDVSLELLNALILLKSSFQRLLAQFKPDSVYQDTVSQFFRSILPKQAIRIAEIELNFMYESFHTDGAIRKHLGYNKSLIYAFLIRSIEYGFCFAALAFYNTGSSAHVSSTEISQADNNVTNLLLWGTLFLESFSYMMTVFSDWTVGALRGSDYGSIIGRYLYCLFPHRWRWWSAANYGNYANAPGWVKFARNVFRRWSDTIYKFNFVRYSFQTRPPGKILAGCLSVIEFFTGAQNLATRRKFLHKEWYIEELGEYVFSKLTDTRIIPINIIATMEAKWPESESYIADVLAWHIATEIMLETDNEIMPENDNDQRIQIRLYSKLLSDYVTYLIFIKPQFFTDSGKNFLDEAQVVRRYIDARYPHNQDDMLPEERLRTCCERIRTLNGNNNIILAHWNNDLNVQRLLDVVSIINGYLATENMDIIWNTLSEKWVELLLYAANKHTNFEHVKGLCQGGELVSIVLILAFHLNIIKK